jgi:DNA-binding MarR family transcriptional regulator
LKKLDERAKTVSELSREVNFYKSAVHRHLSRLIESGLVERRDGDNKWVYYSLTRKGKRILNPQRTEIAILLSTAILSLLGGLISAYYYIKGNVVEKLVNPIESGAYGKTLVHDPFLLVACICFLFVGIVFIMFAWIKQKNNERFLFNIDEVGRDIYDEWVFSEGR